MMTRGGRWSRYFRRSDESAQPSMYSITTKWTPSCDPRSTMGTTLGWCSRAAMRASSRSMWTNASSSARCACSTLIA